MNANIKIHEQINTELNEALNLSNSIFIDAVNVKSAKVSLVNKEGKRTPTNLMPSAVNSIPFIRSLINVIADKASSPVFSRSTAHEICSGTFEGGVWQAVIAKKGDGFTIAITTNDVIWDEVQSNLIQSMQSAISTIESRTKEDENACLTIVGMIKARYAVDGMTVVDPIAHDIYRDIKLSKVTLKGFDENQHDQIIFHCEHGTSTINADQMLLLTKR